MLNIKKIPVAILLFTCFCIGYGCGHAATFSLIALPDTQFYASNPERTQYLGLENPFFSQTDWIVNNTGKENIVFTMHLGDLVDNSSEPKQWEVADKAMNALDDSGISYGVCRGNHDAFEDESFIKWFGPERFKDKSTYHGSGPNGFNSYHIFAAGKWQFLVIFCDWRMEEDELGWVKSILDKNKQYPTIVISHEILGVDGKSPESALDTENSIFIWNELVKDHDQIFLTISGHYHGTAWRVDKNSFGRDVLQMVVDYQLAFANGAGYLRQLIFDTDANTITARTFSPWIELADANHVKLPPYIIPEIKTPDASFTVHMDFEKRFNSAMVNEN